jgi:hypothetical protein
MALVLALVAPAGAAVRKGPDPVARRREVQAQRARNAAQVNVLKASDAELGKALDQLDANVKTQEARAADARQAAATAVQAAADARAAEVHTAARLFDLRKLMQRTAVDAYVRGPSPQGILAIDTRSLSEQATRQFLLDVALGQGSDLADNLRAAVQDLAEARVNTEQAQALALKQQVADSVEQRLEAALAESDSLAALDKQLADDIARRQAALAARISSSVRGTLGQVVHLGAVAVTSVGGIVVASSIAPRVAALLDAAAADGIALGGAGYRSSDGQIATRRANCGGTSYDLYQKPASSCRPPTARPGQSMHEQGLAIDFTWNGSIISSHNTAYQWLSRNASRFGLYNLPSEPWHWSTTGN